MARERLSFDTYKNVTVYTYTTFLDHFKFKVRVSFGKKHMPPTNGPVKAGFEFVCHGFPAHHEAARQGFRQAKLMMDGKFPSIPDVHKYETEYEVEYIEPDPVVWAASIKTGDTWHPCYLDADRDAICKLGRELAMSMKRTVKIHKVEESK